MGRDLLLTLAIPTYNRAAFLTVLLQTLEPQLAEVQTQRPGAMQILIADNASEDETASITQAFADRVRACGMAVRIERHAENIGSDANFIFCYEQAQGEFFWLCGDDDVVVPGGLVKIVAQLEEGRKDLDMVYLASYGFVDDPVEEWSGDSMERDCQTAHSALHFARMVGTMITFISGMVVNRARLESIPHEKPSAFAGTNLTQLSWTLPLLRQHRRSVVVWERLVGGRQANRGGYSVALVFGEKFSALVDRLLPDSPRVAAVFKNYVIRRWFPEAIYEMRLQESGERFQLHAAEDVLKRSYGKNFRYWIFAWPVLRLPLSMAKHWVAMGKLVHQGLYMVRVPGFWRKRS